MKKQLKRNRISYGCILVLVIGIGLCSRSNLALPFLFEQYAGDVLWATMVYLLLCMIRPSASNIFICITTVVFSFCIEFSQLLTFDWLVYLRTTPLRYLLGQGFVYSDLLCYVIGVLIALGMDCILLHLQKKRGISPLINHVQ